MIPTVIDLFAGCGGASLGFKDAGFDVRVAVELDPVAGASYQANHPGTRLILEDISNLSADEILQAANLQPGECTVVIGCPPCQGFSTHRLRAAGRNDPRNELVSIFADRILEIRPAFFLFENVPGLLRQHTAPWFEAKARLESGGYRLVERVIEAADYGIPQRRKRLTAIGCRLPSAEIALPPATHADPRKRTDLPAWRTVEDAIRRFPPLANGERSATDPLHYAARHDEQSLRRFALIPRDGGSRSSLPAELQLKCHARHNGHKDVYGRLWWKRPASTITGGCTQPSKGRFLHPEQDRGLTLREAAALQGFPDDYIFHGTKQQIALQIGNAIPPPLAKSVAQMIRKAWQQALQQLESGSDVRTGPSQASHSRVT